MKEKLFRNKIEFTAVDNYELIKYRTTHKKSWDNFIRKSKNGTFLFQRDFMDYHSDRFMDHSLMVYKNEKLTAVLPANLEGTLLHSHQGLSYGGLVLDSKITFEAILEVFKHILSYLDENGIEILNIKLLPKIYHTLPSDDMEYLLFLLDATLTRRDISSSIYNANSLKIESSNRLRGIKKGVKNGLIVKEEARFEPFWDEVLEPNLKHSHNQKPVHSLEEIKLLQFRFPENIKQFNVYKNDKIVAGTTIFETATVAHAQYISANELGRKTGGLDFLFDYLLRHFSHIKYFDFGISNEHQGLKVNKGLLHWKESFGGRSIVHDFYEIKTKNHHLLNNIYL